MMWSLRPRSVQCARLLCNALLPVGRPFSFLFMDSPEHERVAIEAYMASEAPDANVVHLEKVTSERVIGQDHDVWDVHTDKERWWVITGPTNLYSQSQFPSMDVALSFHVGLMARVHERSRRHAPSDDHVACFAEAWRKWEQAGEALNTADEAEEFQAVGMHCRESLVAFMRTASQVVTLAPQVTRAKAADVKGWAEILGNVITPGDSNKDYRSYLTYVAHQATEHALTSWSLAIMVHDADGPPRCAVCGSYRLRLDYEPGEVFGVMEVLVCDKCGSRGEGVMAKEETKPEPKQAPPEGECITVDTPLLPPFRRP